jgi:hypothetical protein
MCLVNTDCNVICENGVCTTKQCLPIGTGVTAFWKANDDFVESIGGLATFPVGNVTFAPGITGSGFFLDGPGTFVDVPTAPALDLATGLTIDAWINPTDANGGNGRIVDKIAPFGSDGYLLDLIGGHLRGIVGGEGIQTGETVLPNRFTHVALTFEPGAVMTLFIDGRPAAAAPIFQTAVPTNNHPVLFGADQGGGSNFAGVIDNVRLWNNAVDQRSVGLLPGQGRNCP